MRSVRLLTTTLLSLVPLLATAADLPVQYTVQEKQLKAALSGTNLTFELHTDSGCGTPAVYSTVVPIQNVQFITKIKQFTPKNDVKLPGTVALQHTLTGVTASGNLFLQVMGTGVIPVNGACQAQAAQVAPPSCTDAMQNGGESDIDCGGVTSCPRCPNGDSCTQNSDCTTSVCSAGICTNAPSCMDGIENGTETDIDCGGMNLCSRCGTGKQCNGGSDCSSIVCQMGLCAAPTCTDMVKNGGESGVDCGGATLCARCGTGGQCTVGTDCLSNVCNMLMCAAPSCVDGVENGNETDIDCGGGTCPTCANGSQCNLNSDCTSNVCSGGQCVP